MVTVGFVGVGRIGGPMARHHVEAGHEVTVFDIDEEAMRQLVEIGASGADDAAEVARTAEVVFLSLPGPDDVIEVVDAIEGSLAPGSTVIDTTTSTPAVTGEIAKRLGDCEVAVLGAPVSGGTSGAEAGTLTVMVGGDRDVFRSVRPLFDPIASDVIYVGSAPGDAHAVKLLNNYLTYTALMATSEAIVLGRQAGLDPETMIEVFNASSGHNSSTEEKFPNHILTDRFDLGFPLEAMEKDVRLFVEFAEASDTPVLIGNTIRQSVGFARNDQGDEADISHVYTFFERLMTGGGGN